MVVVECWVVVVVVVVSLLAILGVGRREVTTRVEVTFLVTTWGLFSSRLLAKGVLYRSVVVVFVLCNGFRVVDLPILVNLWASLNVLTCPALECPRCLSGSRLRCQGLKVELGPPRVLFRRRLWFRTRGMGVGVVDVGLKKLLVVVVGGSVVVSIVVVVVSLGVLVVGKGVAVVGAWNGKMVVSSSSQASVVAVTTSSVIGCVVRSAAMRPRCRSRAL